MSEEEFTVGLGILQMRQVRRYLQLDLVFKITKWCNVKSTWAKDKKKNKQKSFQDVAMSTSCTQDTFAFTLSSKVSCFSHNKYYLIYLELVLI